MQIKKLCDCCLNEKLLNRIQEKLKGYRLSHTIDVYFKNQNGSTMKDKIENIILQISQIVYFSILLQVHQQGQMQSQY